METIKFNSKQALQQGDVQVFSIDKIPSNAKKVENTFIAKSEKTSHSHTLCGVYDMYEVEDGFIVEVKDDEAVLNHAAYALLTEEVMRTPKALPQADHKPIFLKKGIYYIGIQKRKKHFSKVFEKVID